MVLTLAGACLASEPAQENNQQPEQDPEISTFRSRLSLRFLTNYNFVSIQNSAYGDQPLESNRPLNLGIGFGYDSLFTLFDKSWDLSLEFRYNLPFTTSDGHTNSHAFESGLNFFPGDWWISGNLRYYSGFSTKIKDEPRDRIKFVDMSVTDMYISALWMASANGKFSPRSAYFLERRQKHSAGSIIVGGRLQRNIAEDNDGILLYENNRRDITTTWVDMGYTYSFIFKRGYFLNLWGVLGLAYGRIVAEDDNVLLPEFETRSAFGYLGEKWSWNIVLKSGYSIVLYGDYNERKYVGAIETLGVRRF
ncbi:DUF4421 family protein [uncultured Fibrobacter sp.]|uniref:DUF4421 family protein n=1 Tax=uncultured Fibrobacter sp. TaxID=261512 RepID=UPI0025E6792C|nr:DUF4421 family protein [uncultured Fibrobacter sp.]